MLPDARPQADAAIGSYRLHADVDGLLGEAVPPLIQPIKVASYLLGAMDGSGGAWSDHPEARSALEAAGFAELVDKLHVLLGELWDSQESWEPSLGVFAPLQAFAKEVFNFGGLMLSPPQRASAGWTSRSAPVPTSGRGGPIRVRQGGARSEDGEATRKTWSLF